MIGVSIPELGVLIIGEYSFVRIDSLDYLKNVRTAFILCFAKECLGARANLQGCLGTLRYSIGLSMNAQ